MTAHRGEFARGWRVLAGSIIGIGAGVSSLYFYSLGIFIKPLSEEFGWSRGEASLGALVGTALAAVITPVIGRLADRVGSLPVALASMTFLAGGFVALGQFTQGLTSFLVITGLLSLLTVGSCPVPYTRLMVAGFQQHRGLALGIALAGTGLGAILVPRLLGPYVATAGWRAGYFALAVVVVAAILPMALLLRRVPDQTVRVTTRTTVRSLASNPAFLPLATMFFLAAIAILGTVVQFVPMLSDAGLDPRRAGAIAGVIGIAAIGGRVAVGILLDRLPAKVVTAGLFAIASLGLLALALGGTSLAVPGAVITGLAIGAEVDLLSFQTARYFPPQAFGAASGLLYALFLLGGGLGPLLSGLLFDFSGNYMLSLSAAAALLALAACIALRLPPAPRIADVSTSG